MTSMREAMRRLLGRPHGDEGPATHFSYAVHWTQEAGTWDRARRAAAGKALEELVADPAFVPTEFEHRYTIAVIDDRPHPGASLLALRNVLRALDEQAPAPVAGPEEGPVSQA